MHEILSEDAPTGDRPEILRRLEARIDFLQPRVHLQEVIRIHGNLDMCGVPEDSNIRRLCGKTLIAKLIEVGQQIPTPATT